MSYRPVEQHSRSDVVGRRVLVLCCAVVLLEGFDLFAYSTAVPVLLQHNDWALSAAQAGRIGSYATFGMLIGSLIMGTLTDRFGRRRTITGCVAWFSLFTAVSALAPDATVFGIARFLAGLGLGGLIPAAMPLALEYAPGRGRRKSSAATVMMMGYHLGGLLVAALAIVLLPALGWRSMFWAGAVPIVVLLPLLLRYLPESPVYLLARGRRAEAERIASQSGAVLDRQQAEIRGRPEEKVGVAALFVPHHRVATLLYFVASFMGLLLVYGFGTWLPQLMRASGYGVGSSLSFLVVTNVGAVLGMVLSGRIADRRGSKGVCAVWFAAGSVFVGVISVPMPLVLTYAVVLIAGFFLFTAQVLLYAHVGARYPFAAHATALGWVAGIGRLGSVAGPAMGGVLVGANLGVWNFYVFALAGIVGALAVWLAPTPGDPDVAAAAVPRAAG